MFLNFSHLITFLSILVVHGLPVNLAPALGLSLATIGGESSSLAAAHSLAFFHPNPPIPLFIPAEESIAKTSAAIKPFTKPPPLEALKAGSSEKMPLIPKSTNGHAKPSGIQSHPLDGKPDIHSHPILSDHPSSNNGKGKKTDIHSHPILQPDHPTSMNGKGKNTDIHSHSLDILADGTDTPVKKTLIQKLGQAGENTKQALQKGLSNIKQLSQDAKDLVQVLKPPKKSPHSWQSDLSHPMRALGDQMENLGIAKSADDMLREKLSWIPGNLRGRVKNFMVDVAHYLLDAVCRGRAHKNPRIQQLALVAQKHLAKMNDKMPLAMAMKSIDAICATKLM